MGPPPHRPLRPHRMRYGVPLMTDRNTLIDQLIQQLITEGPGGLTMSHQRATIADWLATKKTPEPQHECQDNGHTFHVLDARTHADPLAAPAGVTCTTCNTHWDIAQPTPPTTVNGDTPDDDTIRAFRHMIRTQDPELTRFLRQRIRTGDPEVLRALRKETP